MTHLGQTLKMVSQRCRAWSRRGRKEWLWAIRRRIHPEGRYRFPFDEDLTIEVCLKDELAINYALAREFEPDISDFFRRAVRPGMVVFDVGANIGHFTLLAAKRVGPGGQVHAFEPASAEFAKLRRNILLNGFENVVANPLAICDHNGDVALQTCDGGLGLYNTMGRPFRSSEFTSSIVPCTTLDDYAQSRGITRVDLIKIDIEGAEPAALAGASALLSTPDAPMLVCEFSDPAAAGMGHSTRELRHLLEGLGYGFFRYDIAAGGLAEEPPREWYDYANLVCCKHAPILRSL
jgi:FkbM family methyltransferase